MVCLHKISSCNRTVPIVHAVWMTRAIGWVHGVISRRQGHERLDDDLQRLAETSPHLLEDIGVGLAKPPTAVSRPAWTRGIQDDFAG